MSEPALNQAIRWSAKRWCSTIAFVLVGQLGVIFWFSPPPRRDSTASAMRENIELLLQPASSMEVSRMPWLADPSQFALVSSDGFSGHLWQSVPRIETPSTEWTEPPRWWTRSSRQFASALVPDASDTGPSLLNLVAKPNPVFPVRQGPPGFIPSESRLYLEGEIADRPLKVPLKLPSWSHTDVLRASEVRVLVDQYGAVLSGVLLASSGFAEADGRALELARKATFAATEGLPASARLSWGAMVFRWVARGPGPPAAPVARAASDAEDKRS